MAMSSWVYAEYSYQNNNLWFKVAEFEVGLSRGLSCALQKAGLSDRGIPVDCSPSVEYFFEDNKNCGIGKTWLKSSELSSLLDVRLWLNDEELAILPLHTYSENAALDAIQAWQAFAWAYESSGSPVRFVIWFAH